VKVLVTGASGFIGRSVLNQLVSDGRFDIVAASRRPEINIRVEWEAIDLLSPGAVESLVRRTRPTHLIHLAWNVQPGVFWHATDNLDWIAASITLLRAFGECDGEHAVIAGTCAEYDWTLGNGRFNEGAPIRPATLYGISKDVLHRAARAAAVKFSMSVAWGRVFWVYGPGEPPGRLVSDVALSLTRNRPIETSSGVQKRDFMYVDDVASAFVAALVRRWDGAFNIGSGTAFSVGEVLDTLARISGRPELIRRNVNSFSNEPLRIEADSQILNSKIGFFPELSMADRLEQTYTWWKARPL
jgi:UDP-glucose 4-epimerase